MDYQAREMNSGYSFKSSFVEIYLKNDILYVIFGKEKITADLAHIIVDERLKVTGGIPYPTLADYRNGYTADKKSREIFASEKACKNVTAGAIIFSNPIHRVLVNAYLWFENPPLPTAVFLNEEKAVSWLSNYKLSKMN